VYAEYNTESPSAKNSIVPIAPGFTTNIWSKKETPTKTLIYLSAGPTFFFITHLSIAKLKYQELSQSICLYTLKIWQVFFLQFITVNSQMYFYMHVHVFMLNYF